MIATSAGTSSVRTTNASSRIPSARPVAITRTGRSGLVLSDRNEIARISAAEVTSRPGVRERADDGLLGRSGPVVLLAHPGEQEHLVVHREPEQEREHEDRDEVPDRAGRGDAVDQVGAVALLPEQHQEAVGGAERDDVQHDGLGGEHDRAERAREQQEGDERDQAEHQREVAVHGGRRSPCSGRCCRRPGRRPAPTSGGSAACRSAPCPRPCCPAERGITLDERVAALAEARRRGRQRRCRRRASGRRSARFWRRRPRRRG